MDLGEPGARARGEEAEVVRDLRERDRDHLERAGDLDERVSGGLGLEGIRRRADRQARLRHELRAHARSELGVRVEAGADGGAAERDPAEPLERRLYACT